MTHRVVVTAAAERDLADIHRFIASERGRGAADVLIDLLLQRGRGLAEFPERGAGIENLTPIIGSRVRSLPLPPYRLFYDVDQDVVTIFAVIHARRDLADLLEERLTR